MRKGDKSIIFTRTKNDAELLSRSMRSIIGSRPLHGNMQQMHRDKTLAAFRSGRFNVLVATDVAARDLDIPNVDLVVHFEMPNTSEIFVHRSGRTGHAGNKGTAIIMFTEGQRRVFRTIERDLCCKFKLHGVSGGSSRRIDPSRRGTNSYGDYDGRSGEDSSFEEDDYTGVNRKLGDRNTMRNGEFNHGNNERPRRSIPRNFELGNSRYNHTRSSRLLNFDNSKDNLMNDRNSNFKSFQWSSKYRTPRAESNATKRNISGHSKLQYRRNHPPTPRGNDSEYDDLLDLFKDQY